MKRTVCIYSLQMGQLATIGASLCTSFSDPEQWATERRCDCKHLPELFSILRREYFQLGDFTPEMTGCYEVRQAWRALKALRDNDVESEGAGA